KRRLPFTSGRPKWTRVILRSQNKWSGCLEPWREAPDERARSLDVEGRALAARGLLLADRALCLCKFERVLIPSVHQAARFPLGWTIRRLEPASVGSRRRHAHAPGWCARASAVDRARAHRSDPGPPVPAFAETDSERGRASGCRGTLARRFDCRFAGLVGALRDSGGIRNQQQLRTRSAAHRSGARLRGVGRLSLGNLS